MKKLFCLYIALLTCCNLFAQNTFHKVYINPDPNGSFLSGMTQSSDEGYIITGHASFNSLILKSDSAGNLKWMKELRSVTTGEIVSTKDGGFALIASLHHSLGIIKLNKKGNQQWVKYFSLPSSKINRAYTITETYDGGYIISGYLNRIPSVIKTDSSGNLKWAKSLKINGDASGYIQHIVNTADSAYAIILNIQNSIFLIKINKGGNLIWEKAYGDTASGYEYYAKFIKKTPDNGFLMGGFVTDNNSGILILKVDSLGNKEWGKKIIIPGEENVLAFSSILSGTNYTVAGFIQDGTNVGHLINIKLNKDGQMLWSRYINTAKSLTQTYKIDIARANNNGFVIGATTVDNELSLLKFDKDGYSCMPATDLGTVKSFGKIINAKTAQLNNIKGIVTFSSDIKIEDIPLNSKTICSNEAVVKNKKENKIQVFDNKFIIYPNPATDNCLIKFYAYKQGENSIQCININGKVVMQKTVIASAGKNTLNIDVSKFSVGTYYVTIKNGEGVTETCKLVKE